MSRILSRGRLRIYLLLAGACYALAIALVSRPCSAKMLGSGSSRWV